MNLRVSHFVLYPLIGYMVLSLVVSCTLEDMVKSVGSGDLVLFRAENTYDNLPLTRTEYSGTGNYVGETLVKERIDWTAGDVIRIWSDKALTADGSRDWADYEVSPASAGGSSSYASISSSEPDGLVWSGGDHVFISVYPSPGAGAQSTAIAQESINAVIPSNQRYVVDGDRLLPDMDYAYMYAAIKTKPSSSVELAFKPMFTAFEFTIGSADDESMVLSKFEMTSSQDLSGSFTAAIAPATDSHASTANYIKGETGKSVCLEFDGGLVLRQGQTKTFTVFAIPFDISDVTIRFTTVSGETKSLLLAGGDGTPVSFVAGKKYRIFSLGIPGSWTYSIEDIPSITLVSNSEKLYGGDREITVISNRKRGDISEPFPWRVQAQVNGNWVESDQSEWPDWLSLSSYSGDGDSNPVTVHIRPNTLRKGQISGLGAEIATVLSGYPERGTETLPYDLSQYDIYGKRNSGGNSSTANCYVIGAPGWYMFPLVYGNSIKEGNVNTMSYNPGVNSLHTLSTFIGADGKSIASPYILQDSGLALSGEYDACVLWEDVMPGYNIVDPESVEVIDAPDGAALACHYIRFFISKDDIKPGNAVIALRDTENGSKILWSWQLWITLEDASGMQSSSVVYRPSPSMTNILYLLNSNLGWAPPISYPALATEHRSVVLRIIQDLPGDQSTMVSVVQQSYSGPSYDGKEYSCTFYQWGRKDPFIASRGYSSEGVQNKCNSSPAGYRITVGNTNVPQSSFNGTESSALYSAFIKEPYSMFRYERAHGALNAWDSDNTAYDTDSKVVKTVYDPCPPGFCVPRLRAFTGFTSSGGNASSTAILGDYIEPDSETGYPNGWLFTSTGTNSDKTQFFALTGMRSGFTGSVVSVRERGYYWTAGRYENNANVAYAESGFISIPRVDPMYNVPNTHALAIRPVRER